MKKYIELKPIRESTADYDVVEMKIKALFKKEIFLPLLRMLAAQKTIQNTAQTALSYAIRTGAVVYSNGSFSGRFNAKISRELKQMGAVWDNASASFKIPISKLSFFLRSEISIAEVNFEEKLEEMDKKLESINTSELVGKLNIAPQFDKTLAKVEAEFKETVKKITIAPQITPEQRETIAREWEHNLSLDIKTFTDDMVKELRATVYDNVMVKGNRREVLIDQFMEKYGVTERKAKFWAKQETSLLMAKYKENRYKEAGVTHYRWQTVNMPYQKTPNAPYVKGDVRYSHGVLEGKVFTWDNPPITTAPGQPERRNNPQQDYNCRCIAIPLAAIS